MERSADGWFRSARALWPAAALVAVILMILSVPGYLNWLDFVQDAPFSSMGDRVFLELGRAFSILCAMSSLSLAALVYWRKRDDRMALYTAYFLLLYGIGLGGPLELLTYHYLGSVEITYVLQGIFFALPMMVFLMVFPNGQFVPRWTLWIMVLLMGCILLYYSVTSSPGSRLPMINDVAFAFNIGLSVLLPFSLVYVQIVRYRKHYTHDERQQAKWAILGIILFLSLMAVSSVAYMHLTTLPPGVPQPVWVSAGSMLWWLALTSLPVCFTIAILRSHLWDIDVVIRRTLIYGAVSAALAAIYFGGVALMQRAFLMITGEESPLAVVTSTLAIAALFTPVRSRVQRAVDRRFYRRKYDAEKTLDSFAAAVRDEVDIDHLSGMLLGVVEETMQPEYVSLWLREPS